MLLSKSPSILPDAEVYNTVVEKLATVYLILHLVIIVIYLLLMILLYKYFLKTKFSLITFFLLALISYSLGIILHFYVLPPEIKYPLHPFMNAPLIFLSTTTLIYLMWNYFKGRK